MLRRLLPLLLALTLALVACGGETDAVDFTRVDASGFAAAVDASPDAIVVDLRTDEEVAVGFIEGAGQLDFYDAAFRSTLESLDREAHYLVYCNSGNRSAQTVRLMKDLGFTHVTELDGGIQAWHGAGLPVVTP